MGLLPASLTNMALHGSASCSSFCQSYHWSEPSPCSIASRVLSISNTTSTWSLPYRSANCNAWSATRPRSSVVPSRFWTGGVFGSTDCGGGDDAQAASVNSSARSAEILLLGDCIGTSLAKFPTTLPASAPCRNELIANKARIT
jgi:hypothetical protein